MTGYQLLLQVRRSRRHQPQKSQARGDGKRRRAEAPVAQPLAPYGETRTPRRDNATGLDGGQDLRPQGVRCAEPDAVPAQGLPQLGQVSIFDRAGVAASKMLLE